MKKDFKITIIEIFKVLEKRVYNMNFSRNVKIINKNQMEKLIGKLQYLK